MASHSAVTIGLLIAAWVVKVIIIGVFMYMYKRFRRREAELQAAELERLQQQATSPYPAPGKPTPAHVVAGLPVVHYHLLAQEHGSYIKGPLATPCVLDTPEQQQQQQQQQIQGKQGSQQQKQAEQQDVPQRQVLQLHASAGPPVEDTTSDTAPAAAVDATPLPPDALVVTILDANEAVIGSSSSSSCSNSSSSSSNSAGACPNQEAPLTTTTTTTSDSSSSRRSSLDSEGHDQCSICFSCYGAKDAVMVLPCGHYYHQGCVATWLTRDCTCPLCKRYVYRLDPQQVAAAGGTQEVAGSPDHQQQDQQQQAVGAPVTAAGQQSGGNSSNGNRGEEVPRRGLAATAATFTQQLRASGAGMLGIVVH